MLWNWNRWIHTGLSIITTDHSFLTVKSRVMSPFKSSTKTIILECCSGDVNTTHYLKALWVANCSIPKFLHHLLMCFQSRPDLSRIRTCCKGYTRNVYNAKICEPVCSKECVNALCTAPETCTCFPDHVRNAAGFCVATCPIGCQNGHCSGGECLCKEGFKLDIDGRFCLPNCRGNCGGVGENERALFVIKKKPIAAKHVSHMTPLVPLQTL